MAVSGFLPAVLGVTAFLATAATLALDIVLTTTTWASTSPVHISAIVAAAFEGVVLIVLCSLSALHFRAVAKHDQCKLNGAWFAMSLLTSVMASAATVVVLVSMGNATDLPTTILGSPTTGLLVGSAVALGFAFAAQMIFIVVYFVIGRLPRTEQALSLHTDEEGRRSPSTRIKAIPYSQTSTSPSGTEKRQSTDYHSPPGSSSGRSETMSSIRSSLSHAVRPMGSKTRLLSNSSRSARRPPSLDSNAQREPSSVLEDGFDSWDTSAVDGQTRLTVLETSSPPAGRFLETIPASPATSRSASPGCPLDLEPPRPRRRSRSYSPRPQAERVERPTLTTHASTSELHIHPLFRSDSPTPPPAATPGTMVVAAPNAGQTISERSLTRMRSGSLPTVPSPLSRQGSYESFQRKSPSPNGNSPLREEAMEERKMTPPIPEWILSAGSRTSLTEYHSRKLRDKDGSVSPEAESAT